MSVNQELAGEMRAYFGKGRKTSQSTAAPVPVKMTRWSPQPAQDSPAGKGIDPALRKEMEAFFGRAGDYQPTDNRDSERQDMRKKIAQHYGAKPEDLIPPTLTKSSLFKIEPLTEGQIVTATAHASTKVAGQSEAARGAKEPKKAPTSVPAGDACAFFARAIASGKREVGYLALPGPDGQILSVPACSAY